MAENNQTEIPASIRDQFNKIMKEKKISEKKQEQLWERIVEEYGKVRYESGEAIGIVSAQSVSEPATQMTMRTYHFAGSAGIQVTLGLPRIMEVLDARREPATPMMTIYLEKDYSTNERARKLAVEIAETKLADIAIEETIDLMELELKIKLDEDKLKMLNLDSEEIKARLNETKGVKAVIRGSILTVTPDSEDYVVKDLQKLRHKILKVHLKGIKGISQALVKQEKNEWVIYTLGSSLAKVFAIKGVDAFRTRSNDIHEIEEVLGIEAARSAVIYEAEKVLGDQGLDVDSRHVMLISDMMTFSGAIRAIGRYGVAGQKASVLARAAFEETVKHLTKASLKGEKDKLKGIIENIMIGQVAPAGTGTVRLIAKPMKKEE